MEGADVAGLTNGSDAAKGDGIQNSPNLAANVDP